MTKDNKKEIEEIASQVEKEFEMGGLSVGLYLDFATEVALRYANKAKKDLLDEVEELIKNNLDDLPSQFIKGSQYTVNKIKYLISHKRKELE